jgi:hypothetical protein
MPESKMAIVGAADFWRLTSESLKGPFSMFLGNKDWIRSVVWHPRCKPNHKLARGPEERVRFCGCVRAGPIRVGPIGAGVFLPRQIDFGGTKAVFAGFDRIHMPKDFDQASTKIFKVYIASDFNASARAHLSGRPTHVNHIAKSVLSNLDEHDDMLMLKEEVARAYDAKIFP